MRRSYLYCLLIVALAFFCMPLQADEQNISRCETFAATLEVAEGAVAYQIDPSSDWVVAEPGSGFCYGDRLKVLEFRAAIRLENDTLVRLKEGSIIHFIEPDESFWVELIKGAAHFISRTPKSFNVKAPYVNAAVEGTEFVVNLNHDFDRVKVIEGRVVVSNEFGLIQLEEWQSSTIYGGAAPTKDLKVQFKDVAEWVLHYPALIPSNVESDTLTDHIKHGNFSAALSELSLTLEESKKSRHFVTRIALNMYLGNIESALHDIQTLEGMGEELDFVYSVLSVSEIVRANKTKAQEYVEKALLVNPNSASALLAMSYVLQADGDLNNAFQLMKKMMSSSADPIVYARSIELALMTSHYSDAQKWIKKFPEKHFLRHRIVVYDVIVLLAKHQNELAKDRLVKGFSGFEADPVVQFIGGLVDMRLSNKLSARRKMELAVCLDPANGLYRSYLGKIYSQERRDADALDQFNLSELLSLNNPTGDYYKGLHFQNRLQFVKSIDALNSAISKNDGSIVLKSESLVQRDAAIRQASIANVYSKLGLTAKAKNIASKGLDWSPLDYSSHLLSAEIYSKDSISSTAKQIEKSSSELLKPLGVNPLPLGMSESGGGLFDGVGPASLGVNEYNALFLQEGLNFDSVIYSGAKNTVNVDAYASVYGDGVQFGAGFYDYRSDGISENDDVEYSSSEVSMQWQITPEISAQTAMKNSQHTVGDIGLRFLPEFEDETYRDLKEEDLKRLSILYAGVKSSFVVSYASKDFDQELEFYYPGEVYYSSLRGSVDQSSAVWMFESSNYKSLLGLSNLKLSEIQNPEEFGEEYIEGEDALDVVEYYWYNYFSLFERKLNITVGIESLEIERQRFEYESPVFNLPENDVWLPKLGVRWDISSDFEVRFAYGESYNYKTRGLHYTLRPTMNAGFDQVVDGPTHQKLEYLGFAGDGSFGRDFVYGFSYMTRRIVLPLYLRFGSYVSYADNRVDNQDFSLYLNKSFWDKASLNLTLNIDEYERVKHESRVFSEILRKLNRRHLVSRFGLELGKGVYSSVDVNVVEQDIARQVDLLADSSEEENFTTVDVSVDYSMLGGAVILGVLAKNIFNEEFQEYSPILFTTESRPLNYTFIPESAVFGYVAIRL